MLEFAKKKFSRAEQANFPALFSHYVLCWAPSKMRVISVATTRYVLSKSTLRGFPKKMDKIFVFAMIFATFNDERVYKQKAENYSTKGLGE